jgi:hypothetical protein
MSKKSQPLIDLSGQKKFPVLDIPQSFKVAAL